VYLRQTRNEREEEEEKSIFSTMLSRAELKPTSTLFSLPFAPVSKGALHDEGALSLFRLTASSLFVSQKHGGGERRRDEGRFDPSLDQRL
jgi:hypothetical protein